MEDEKERGGDRKKETGGARETQLCPKQERLLTCYRHEPVASGGECTFSSLLLKALIQLFVFYFIIIVNHLEPTLKLYTKIFFLLVITNTL